MIVYCVDDNSLHRKIAMQLVRRALDPSFNSKYEIIECANGNEFIQKSSVQTPSLVILDINMPEMDGLTALAKFRRYNRKTKVVMASSESAEAVARRNSNNQEEIPSQKKQELLDKVISRVKANRDEEGKINSILEACMRLGLDPVEIATQLGADEYLLKPYNLVEAAPLIQNLMPNLLPDSIAV